MSARRAFFDTNVLLYLLAAEAKADQVEDLLASGGTVSVQVLNEFASTALRKLKLTWPEIREVLAGVRATCGVVPVTGAIHEKGLAIAERYQFSFYDSLILAAAQEAGCRIVYSADMQHGQVVASVTVRNPFRSEG